MNPIIFLIALGIILIVIVIRLFRTDVKEFPPHWGKVLVRHVNYYKNLNQTDKKRFQERMMLFLSEISIEGIE